MSRPLKKARAVFPLEEYVEEMDDEPKDDVVDEIVNADFIAHQAEERDFHGIKRLLLQCFRGIEVDVSGIADIIISQNYIGSVVKNEVSESDDEDEEEEEEDKDDILGVTSIINLTSRKDEGPVSSVRSALVEKCQKFGSDATNTLVRESLGNESKHVGLLISERLVNLPPQFALPVYDSLLKELAAARKKGMPYDFTYLVLISKILKEKKKKSKSNSGKEFLFSNTEEEIFYEESIASFDYCINGSSAFSSTLEENDDEYIPWRRVIVIDAKKLPVILNKVRQELYS